MRGRKPQPKAGSIKAKSVGFPNPPTRLSDAARNEWRRVGHQMEGQLIGALDVAILEAYCNTYARVRQIGEEIKKLGTSITFDTKGGAKMISFIFSSAAKQEAHLAKLASELGLTPLSRTRLSVGKPPATKAPPAPTAQPRLKIAE